jgi:hypothetical protein
MSDQPARRREYTDAVNPFRESFDRFRRDKKPEPLAQGIRRIDEIATDRSPEWMHYAKRRLYTEMADVLPEYLDWSIRLQEETEHYLGRPRYTEIRLSLWPASWTKEILASVCAHRAFILDPRVSHDAVQLDPKYDPIGYLSKTDLFLIRPESDRAASAVARDFVNHPTHRVIRLAIGL